MNAPVNAVDPVDVVDLVERCMGEESQWLRFGVGAAPDDAVTLAGLLDDDGRGLDELLADWRRRDPHDPPEYAAGVVSHVAWMMLAPQLAVLSAERSFIDVDLQAIAMSFPSGHDEPADVWWPAVIDVRHHVDPAGVLDRVVADVIEVLTPLVRATRQRVPVGTRGLWGRVADVFTALGPSYEREDVARRDADLLAFLHAARGTVLELPIELVDIARPDGDRKMVRTIACCFAYKSDPDAESDADDSPTRPWNDGPWARYCMSCPLIPVEETIARANYWLDHP
jgi:hypothetical protein